MKAVIFGLEGPQLSSAEAAFFKASQPLGFILFSRNIQNEAQVCQLTQDLRAVVGRANAPILIDQEGGRVQRMRAPCWSDLPAAETFGKIYDSGKHDEAFKAVSHHAEALAQMLLDVGVNVDCWPCLDVATPEVSPALGNRLFSSNPETVSVLANHAVEEMLTHGLMPVVKHLPGYGRATVDPHKSLPIVRETMAELEQDFAPFRAVDKAVWGMTAHVLYTALDDKNPATVSQKVIDFIRHDIGFMGFLVTDDISMGALDSDVNASAKACLKAGCDAVLHCNGKLDEMKDLAEIIPELTDAARVRLARGWELLS